VAEKPLNENVGLLHIFNGSLGFHMKMFVMNILRLLQKAENPVNPLKPSSLAYDSLKSLFN
jgi:hypothetical protein